MKIVTVTLSPAFDLHCFVPVLSVGCEHLATVLRRDIGGKGINISRVLSANGTENIAIIALGKDNKTEFSEALRKEKIAFRLLEYSGRVRENITVHTEDGEETRLSFSDGNVPAYLLERVEKQLVSLIEPETVVSLTGRVPDGVAMHQVKQLLLRLKAMGVRVVIDSRSFSKDDIIECSPWLIKPNEEELSEYFGEEICDINMALSAANAFHEDGVENVMVTLGKKGALLVCSEGHFLARAPEISARSTIGAGDSSIAGFLTGFVSGKRAEECLRLAVAYGSAACLTEGTSAPAPHSILELFGKITVQKL